MGEAPHILSIDQGTTSSRAIVFDRAGRPVAVAQREFEQHFPDDGWVEHDPEDIWASTVAVCREALAEAQRQGARVVAIGITNQRETTVVWDRHTGKAVYNAIVWQDRRTADFCQALKADGHESAVSACTGLLLDPYFSASKVAWILDNVEGARARAERGDLAFGTVDSFLLWRLTEGRVHATDATNASRTMLFNIHQQCWDESLLKLFSVPRGMMPEVLDSAADFGTTSANVLGQALPVYGIAGDQQAAAFGQTCFRPGMLKSTYGTGCFALLNTGTSPMQSRNRLLTTVAYRLYGQPTYALEGSIFVAGAAVQWLRDCLHLISNAAETEQLAREAESTRGVYLVPAFTGLGAPYWDPNARGAIFGLTRNTGIGDLVHAALDSVCYQTVDLIDAMVADGSTRPDCLRADGGMAANSWLLGRLADLTDMAVERPEVIETTALGAAYLAGLQAGVYQSLDEISDCWLLDERFEPHLDAAERGPLLAGWHRAVARVCEPAPRR